MNCPLCESHAKITRDDSMNLTAWVECSVCGKYGFSDYVERELNQHKEKLIPILIERRIRGYSPIIITSEESSIENSITLATLLLQYPNSPLEMIDRSLRNLSKLIKHPCDSVTIEKSTPEMYLFFPGTGEQQINQVAQMGTILEDQGYVNRAATSGSFTFTITPEGWEKIEEIETSNIESKQAFAAMWFNKYTEAIWEDGLCKGIKDAEYSPLKINNKEHNNKICDEIIAEIRRSKFIVADFTGNRGGVYYEAGFAKGLGIPVIWTIEEEWLTQNKEKLHFDTRQYNHIMYKDPADLRDRLKNRILATII